MGLFGALSLAGLAQPALADGEEAAAPSSGFSGTLALTTDYRFRGISQTDGGVALQGSIDYNHASGLFAGAWASNIDFKDGATYDLHIELDLYAGYNFSLSQATSGTIKAVYYAYPDADTPAGAADYDYIEVIGSLSRDFNGKATATLEYAWSSDYFAETGEFGALTGTLEVPLAETLWFFDGGLAGSAHAGYQWIDDNATYGVPDYFYYDIGMSASVGMLTVDARWIDTDIDKAECVAGLDWCEGTFVLTGSISIGE